MPLARGRGGGGGSGIGVAEVAGGGLHSKAAETRVCCPVDESEVSRDDGGEVGLVTLV
jgi:hypothetical protein